MFTDTLESALSLSLSDVIGSDYVRVLPSVTDERLGNCIPALECCEDVVEVIPGVNAIAEDALKEILRSEFTERFEFWFGRLGDDNEYHCPGDDRENVSVYDMKDVIRQVLFDHFEPLEKISGRLRTAFASEPDAGDLEREIAAHMNGLVVREDWDYRAGLCKCVILDWENVAIEALAKEANVSHFLIESATLTAPLWFLAKYAALWVWIEAKLHSDRDRWETIQKTLRALDFGLCDIDLCEDICDQMGSEGEDALRGIDALRGLRLSYETWSFECARNLGRLIKKGAPAWKIRAYAWILRGQDPTVCGISEAQASEWAAREIEDAKNRIAEEIESEALDQEWC